MLRFKRVVKAEMYHTSFTDDGEEDMRTDLPDWLLILTAIPFLGTLMIIMYFIVRRREVYWEQIPINDKKRKE